MTVLHLTELSGRMKVFGEFLQKRLRAFDLSLCFFASLLWALHTKKSGQQQDGWSWSKTTSGGWKVDSIDALCGVSSDL